MTSLRRFFIGVASLVAGAASVGATTITGQIVLAQSAAFTAMTAGAGGSTSQTVSVAKFNATAVQNALTLSCTTGHTCSNVTLTAINLTMNSTVINSLTATNANAAIKTISNNWAVIADLTLDLAGSTGLGLAYDETVPTLNSSATFTVAAKSGTVNGTATKSTGSSGTSNSFGIAGFGSGVLAVTANAGKATVNVNSPYAVSTNEFYNAAGTTGTNNRNLGATLFNSDFIGTGSTSYTLGLTSTLKSPTLQSNVTYSAQSALSAGGNVQIQYTYSYDDTVNAAVPEPTSMALFGSALVGIGLLRRRSRRS